MSSAAILCPGPSLPHTWKGREGYASVIGVNRGAFFSPCDVWSFIDPTHIVGLPIRWWTQQETQHRLRGRRLIPPAVACEIVEDVWDRVPQRIDGSLAWTTFSTPSAVIRAFLDGATRIDVYGHDMTPDAPDFDGVQTTGNTRNAARFEHEAAVMEAITKYLADRGCEVRIKCPD